MSDTHMHKRAHKHTLPHLSPVRPITHRLNNWNCHSCQCQPYCHGRMDTTLHTHTRTHTHSSICVRMDLFSAVLAWGNDSGIKQDVVWLKFCVKVTDRFLTRLYSTEPPLHLEQKQDRNRVFPQCSVVKPLDVIWIITCDHMPLCLKIRKAELEDLHGVSLVKGSHAGYSWASAMTCSFSFRSNKIGKQKRLYQ